MWYDYRNVLSRNALFNFIIGERGVGKTYGAIKLVISRFLKTGEQFIYLRRYKTELKTSVPNFFNAITSNNEFKEHELTVDGSNFKCDGKICGYAISLSTSNILKSTSFPRVKWIIFDEFIIDKGTYHYLRNEVTQFLDMYETIARLRNDVRVLFLGNAISITNPYFNEFELTLPYNSTFKLFKDGSICVNYIKNEEYRKVKKESRFGKLIEGTSYGKYAIDNEFLRDSKSFIHKKPSDSKFFFIIIINGTTYGVWHNKDSIISISKDYDPKCPVMYSLSNDDHNDNTILVKQRGVYFIKALIESYRHGKLWFENQKIKNEFIGIFNHLLTY